MKNTKKISEFKIIEFIDYVFCSHYYSLTNKGFTDESYRPYILGTFMRYLPYAFLSILFGEEILKAFENVVAVLIFLGPMLAGIIISYLVYKVFGRFDELAWESLLKNSLYKRTFRTIWVINIITVIIIYFNLE